MQAAVSVHCRHPVTPGGHRMVPSAAAARCLQRAHTIRMLPGVTAVLSAFFVPDDLDL